MAYGSNADRLKKAMANHSRPSMHKSSSTNRLPSTSYSFASASTSSSAPNSRYSMCSTVSSSSSCASSQFQDSVAHLVPYFHGTSTQHSEPVERDSRRSTGSSGNSNAPSNDDSIKSPKRLFERRAAADSPNMITTSAKEKTAVYPESAVTNKDAFMMPPTTPVLEDQISKFTNYVYENENLEQNSDLFLSMRAQALNLDLDNELAQAYVSTIKQPSRLQSEAITDTMSTTSSYSRALNYECFDYESMKPSFTDDTTITSPGDSNDEESAAELERKSSRFGSKVRRFAKKIAA